MSLTMQLVLEWGIGAAVFIRCFVDRRGTLNQIYSKLGNGFSMFPFACIVVINDSCISNGLRFG